MKKNLFSTMLALLTIVAMLVSVGCKNYDDDISEINKKLSELEGGSIAAIQSQVASLNSSVSALQSTEAAIEKEIEEVEEAVVVNLAAIAALADNAEANAADIANLKLANQELTAEAAVLKNDLAAVKEAIEKIEKSLAENYVDNDHLKATLATYATQEYVTDAIAAAKSAMSEDLKAIVTKHIADSAAFAQTCADLKAAIEKVKEDAQSAAGETLKKAIEQVYTDIQALKDDLQAQIDANVRATAQNAADIEKAKEDGAAADAALQAKIEENAAVIAAQAAEIAELQESVGQAVGDLTAKVEKALSSIEVIEGKLAGIDGTVADAISEAISKFSEETVPALKQEIEGLKAKVEALEGSVQSVVFVPQNTAGTCKFETFCLDPAFAGTSGYYALRATSVMYFKVKPASAAAELTADDLKFEYTTVATKAAAPCIDNIKAAKVSYIADKDLLKVQLCYYMGNITKQSQITDVVKATAVSLYIDKGVTKVQSSYVQNEASTTESLQWGITTDFKTVIQDGGAIDAVNVPWDTEVASSSRTLMENYQFAFWFDSSKEYTDNAQGYMSLDEINELTGLNFAGVQKADYDADKKEYKTTLAGTTDNKWFELSCTGAGEWKELKEGLPTFKFSKALTGEGVPYGVKMNQYYAVKCGSKYFPVKSGSKTYDGYEFTPSYNAYYSTGADVTVEDMQQDWTYDFVSVGKTQEATVNPEIKYYRKPIESSSIKDMFQGTIKTTVEKLKDGKWVASDATGTVTVTPQGYGHEVDEFEFVLNESTWKWNTTYRITGEAIGSDKKVHHVYAVVKATEQPGEYKEKAEAGLWNAGDYVIYYNPAAVSLGYNKDGIYAAPNAWEALYNDYKKFFSGMTQDEFAALMNAKLGYATGGTLSGWNSTLYAKDKDGEYAQVAAPGNSGAYSYQMAKVKDSKGAEHPALRGYIDPTIISAFSTDYRQIVTSPTWFNVRFVSLRDINVTLDSFTLTPNPTYISSVGGVDKATFTGEKNGSTIAPTWTYVTRDLSGFYSLSGIPSGATYKITYSNSIAKGNKFGETFEHQNNQKLWKDKDNSVIVSYPYINKDDNTVSFENSTKLDGTDGFDSAKPNVITGIWVKVSAEVTLAGGAKIAVPDAYFQFDVVDPIASFTVAAVPQVAFMPGETVTATDPTAATNVATSAQGFFRVKDYYGEELLYIKAATKTTPASVVNNITTYFTGAKAVGFKYWDNGLGFDFKNAKAYIGTQEVAFDFLEGGVNGISALDDDIRFDCKSGYKLANDIDVVIPVYVDHNVLDSEYGSSYWETDKAITPFKEGAELHITIKK